MTDENETVHQIELEMQRLMKIINGDQEIISKKNNEISELHSLLKSKETEIRLVRSQNETVLFVLIVALIFQKIAVGKTYNFNAF